MKIYISGQISGLTEAEYKENFKNAAYDVYKLYPIITGHYFNPVVNPLEIYPLFGIKKWLFYMIADLWQLRKCTHIALMSNWKDSKGACIEHFIGKFIFNIVEGNLFPCTY